MRESFMLWIRGGVLLAFLLAMPALAHPLVGRAYDRWLFGETEPVGAAEPEPMPPDSPPQEPSPTPVEVMPLPVETARPQASSLPSVDPEDPLERLSNRLKDLGAEYLRLESMGGPEEVYRTTCRVPLSAGAPYSRLFEATGADPVSAFENVLAQVEAWRQARGPAAQTVDFEP